MILGIDFGLAHIGLATSEGMLAEPYSTLTVKDQNGAIKQIDEVCKKLYIETIVIGVSEGKSAQNAMDFGKELEHVLRLPVKFVDETLSSIEAGNSKNDHQKAAAIILQRYLDNNG